MLSSIPTLASLALAASLFLAATTTHALPNGAPGCTIDIPRISKMGGTNQELNYRIHPAAPHYTPDEPFLLRLEGEPYKGLLLFVTSLADPNVRVGNFIVPRGFKSNKDVCDAQGFHAGPNGVITHTDASVKPSNTEFTWMPGHQCVDVEVEAVVAQEKNRWQVLPKVRLSCTGGGNHAGGDYFDNGASDDYQGDGAYAGGDHMPATFGKKPCRKPGDAHYDTPSLPYHGGDANNGHDTPSRPTYDDNSYGPVMPPHHDGEMTYDGRHPPGVPSHRRKCRKRPVRPHPRRRRKCKKRVHRPRHVPEYEGAETIHDDRPPMHSDYPSTPVPHYDGSETIHADRPEHYDTPDDSYHGDTIGDHVDRPVHGPIKKPCKKPIHAGGDHVDMVPDDSYAGGDHVDVVPGDSYAGGDHVDMPVRDDYYAGGDHVDMPVHDDTYVGGDTIGDHVDRPIHGPIKKPCKKPVHGGGDHVDVIPGDSYAGGDHVDVIPGDSYAGGDHVDVVPGDSYAGGDHVDMPETYHGDTIGDHVDLPVHGPIKKPCTKGQPGRGGEHVDVPVYDGDALGDHHDAPSTYSGDDVDHHDETAPDYHGDADAMPMHSGAGDYFAPAGANDNQY